VGKPERKRRFARPSRKWEDTTRIKMDLQELRCGGMDWIDLAEDRDCRALVYAVINIWVV